MRRTRAKGREARGTVGEGGEEGKKRKNPQKGYGRNVENEGDSDGRRKNRREEIVGSVYVDTVYLENSKKAEREAQGTQG